MDSGDPKYEERLVLFLDILGFKELIKKTEKDEAFLGRLVAAIDHIKQISHESEFYKTQRVTQFSDCIVISYRVNEPAAVFDLINSVGFMLIDCVFRGCRSLSSRQAGRVFHAWRSGEAGRSSLC